MKENLELLVTRAKDVDRNLAKVALEAIGTEIRYVGLIACDIGASLCVICDMFGMQNGNQ